MPGMPDVDLLGMLIATLGGTAVGLERQRSGHADGPNARFAGIRTFTLLGGLAGLSGWLWTAGLTAPAVVLLGAAAAITAAAYVAASRRDVDGTTEIAALVVMAAGVTAGIGAYRLASGIIAITSLLLVEKSRLHALAARIDDVGLRAGVRFAVMALVVLPLLPRGPYGPFGGVRPRELWALVLLFSGLSFVAYIARRIVGPGRGYFVTGLLGGLVSSTNVTFTFARTSRTDPVNAQAIAVGAVAGNAMLYPRVLVATSVLNPPLVLLVLPYLVLPGLVAATVAAIGFRRTRSVGVPAAGHGQSPAVDGGAPDGAPLSGRADGGSCCGTRRGRSRRVRRRDRAGVDGRRRSHGLDGKRRGTDGLSAHGGGGDRAGRPLEHRVEAGGRFVVWQPAVQTDRGRRSR